MKVIQFVNIVFVKNNLFQEYAEKEAADDIYNLNICVRHGKWLTNKT